MILKGKLSRICPHVDFTYDVIQSMLGKPITKDGKTIGIICGIDPKRDDLRFDIDDEHVKDFMLDKFTSFEIVGD